MGITGKIYPTLEATAPDPIVFRIEELKHVRQKFEKIIADRRHYYKKYSKAKSSLQTTQVVLSSIAVSSAAASIATAVTVIGIPIAAILGGVSIVTGFLSGVSLPIIKYIDLKRKKHDRIYVLVSTGLNNIIDMINRAISDGKIDDQEFSDIMNIVNKIEKEIANKKINNKIDVTEDLEIKVKNKIISDIKNGR